MPLLDVSDLLADPDFADTFALIRASEAVDDDGVAVSGVGAPTTLSGVIQPASEATLVRLADGSRIASTLEIHTTFPLTCGAGGIGADRIVVRGATYKVTDVADWTRFGAGFVRAIATLKDLNPGQPG